MFIVLMSFIVGLGTGAAVQKYSERDERLHSAAAAEIEWAAPCVEEMLYEIQSDEAPNDAATIKAAALKIKDCMKFGAAHGDI